jgi:aldehyde dehydrogenase (NAD+)
MNWKHQPFIGGHHVPGRGKGLKVVNPATEEVFAEVETASPPQFEAAILAARHAFDSAPWATRPATERAQAVHRLLDYLASRNKELISTIIAEAGCPVNSAVMFVQVDAPIGQGRQIVDYFLKVPHIEENPLPLEERVNAFGGIAQSLKQYQPVGVVAAITAYNFPFYTNIWKVVPALMAGNTVILRPNPLTPLSATIFGEAAMVAGLPEGVLNVVVEEGYEGAMLLTTHPGVDMVAFTGSSVVGSKVMAQAAPTMKRLQLELGGKSAQIFLSDSLDAAAQSPLTTCLAHAGQGCSLPTRVLVPRADKAQVMDRMVAAMAGIVVGNPADEKTQMGPVISAAQRERCERIVGLAVEAGGKVVTGGHRPAHLNRGYYFEPTLLDVPDSANPAAQQEIFGPVISVLGYDDLDHAVRIANGSSFGLSGYVIGKNRRQALDVATRLRTGTVNVNGGVLSAYVSSGGWGLSGLGRERGLDGIRIYQNVRCLNIGA